MKLAEEIVACEFVFDMLTSDCAVGVPKITFPFASTIRPVKTMSPKVEFETIAVDEDKAEEVNSLVIITSDSSSSNRPIVPLNCDASISIALISPETFSIAPSKVRFSSALTVSPVTDVTIRLSAKFVA